MIEQPCSKCGNLKWKIDANDYYFYIRCRKCKRTQWRIENKNVESISALIWVAKELLKYYPKETEDQQ